MDMDDSPHNWLAFSLSNQPSFLEAFSSEQHHQGVTEGEDDGDAGMANLAMLADMGPKLEDFLGSCREPAGRYSSGKEIDVHGADTVMCEYNELKTIASSYLCGTPATNRPEEKAIVPAETRKAVETFGQRTSIYRGVTRHRWTGRYEAHLWDNSCRREGQSRKGRQVYLGGYDKEDKAARAYDLAALKYWGPTTTTNFPVSNYEKEVEEMQNMSRQEFVASLRRKSSGFSRGASMYRGVTRHHQHGRWQARIGRVAGNKDLYLGTFSTQEEAAEAYDIAAIKFRGLNAVTNFDMSRYDVKSIANSSLPIGGMSGRTSKATESSSSSSSDTLSIEANRDASTTTAFGFAPLPIRQDHDYWTMVALHQQQQQQLGLGLGFGVNMDFSTGSASVSTGQECAAGNLVWSNGVLQLQQQPEQSDSGNGYNSIPYATPITALGGSYEGNWVKPAAPTYYYHPVGKQNGALQTPIYGIE